MQQKSAIMEINISVMAFGIRNKNKPSAMQWCS